MKKIENRKPGAGGVQAFTLVELLVVIAIIAILAGMLMPVITKAIVAAQKGRAKTEMAGLVTAIQSYYQDYSRFPISAATQTAAAAGTGDFTYTTNNSEVIAILMDYTGMAQTDNAGHQKNPKQVKYLNPRIASDALHPGVYTGDYVYRDPWAHPYVITMDLNFDGVCNDPLQGSIPGTVIVWSYGPNTPTSVNSGNVLSWQ